AVLGQLGQEPGMVDMGVRQQQVVDALGVERERIQVEVTNRLVALEHPAIDEELALGMDDAVARARDRARRAMEDQADGHILLRCAGYLGARLARMRCSVRLCMFSRRAVSDTLR